MADAVRTSAADCVLVITLNRPEVKNAIDSALFGTIASRAMRRR